MPRKKLSFEEDTISINLRIPVSVRDRIEKCARRDNRFLSQEVRYLLELALKVHEREIQKEDNENQLPISMDNS